MVNGSALLSAKKRKKLKLNQFGCINVGKPCRGKDSKCCSGICQGKKPKKGEKDKSRCVGHDEGTCSRGLRSVPCGGASNTFCTNSRGQPGVCETTTGNAAHCNAVSDCFPCKRDVDCQPICGPKAACIQCGLFCPHTGGTACAGLADGDCDFSP
jgi:hypothetical protein